MAVLLASLALADPATGGGRLVEILERHRERLAPVLERSEELRLQILLATVVEREGEPPGLERSGWRVDAEYFYPASAIKLCAAVAALEELNGLEAPPSVTLDSPLTLAPVREGDPLREADPTNRGGGTITVRHEIRKLCLVSDNEAFNRLYDLVGQRALNERMWAAGLRSTRLRHRLSVRLTAEENRRTPRVELQLSDGPHVWPARTSDLDLPVVGIDGLDLGVAFQDGDERIEGPVSFRAKNSMSLGDLQDLLVKIVRPDVELGTPPFALTEAQRALLLEAMTQLPRESTDPRYDPERHPDDHVKFLMPGLLRVVPAERLRITNKVGRAYGFSIENAWVRDVASGRSFFVACVLYTNANGVLNDGVYEYEAVADPFLADLGEVLGRELLGGGVGERR